MTIVPAKDIDTAGVVDAAAIDVEKRGKFWAHVRIVEVEGIGVCEWCRTDGDCFER